MSRSINPFILVALVILILALSGVAFVAFAGEPGDIPPGELPETPDTPDPPDPLGNRADLDPDARWAQMLANLDEHENRVYLDNVSDLDECFVELPLFESIAMLDNPEKTARVVRFIFTFKPWRQDIKPAVEIDPEILIAIAAAYEKKKNTKLAAYVEGVAKTLYPQSPAVRKISGYVMHGGGWVLKDMLPKDLPPKLSDEILGKMQTAFQRFKLAREPILELENLSQTVKHPLLYMILGDFVQIVEENEYVKAAGYYRKAIELDPAWMEAYEKLGWALCGHAIKNVPSRVDLLKINEAISMVRAADSIWVKAHENLGNELHAIIIVDKIDPSDLKEVEGKIKSMRHLDSSWLKSHDGLGNLMIVYLEKKIEFSKIVFKLDEAIAEAHRYDPLGGVYILPAAECAYRTGNRLRANRLFKKAIELDPTLAIAWLRRSQIHSNAELTEIAMELLNDGLKACPGDAGLLFEKALLLSKSGGSKEELKKTCKAYLEAFPDGPRAAKVREYLKSLDLVPEEEKKEPEKPGEEKDKPEEKPDGEEPDEDKTPEPDKENAKENGK